MTNQTKLSFIIIFFTSICYSNNDVENIIRVADALYTDSRFELAIIEYKRASILYPKNEYNYQIQSKMALCYKKLGYFIEAINIHKTLLEIDLDQWESIIEIASIYQLLNQFSESNRFIKKHFLNLSGGKKDSLMFLMSCNYFAVNKVDSSKFYFNLIKEKDLKKLIDRNHNLITQFEHSKKYNHKTAKYLNTFFPGAGYLYLDMPQTFVATLFVESLFFYATLSTYKNQNIIGTLFGGMFFSGFYLGSIYGAEQFAKKKTKNMFRKYYDRLIFDFY